MDHVKQKVDRFIRRVIANDEAIDVSRIVILHCPQGGKPTSVWSRKFEEGPELADAETIVGEIWQAMGDDASGMGGVQRYQIVPYLDGKPRGRLTARMQGYDESYDSFDSEGATPTGLIAQQMRHNEALAKTSHMAMGQVVGMLTRMLDKSMGRNEKLISQRFEYFDALEDARSQKHEREMEMLEAAGKAHFRESALEKIGLLAPAVVNRLSGQSVLPEAETPKTLMLKGIVGSITPEQMASLQQILTVEQQIPLMELIQSIQQEQQNADGSGSGNNGNGTN